MNRFLQTGLLLLVGLCMLTEVAAQSMKVVSFRKLENDMTPKLQGTARFDNNGRTSALIRVVAPGKGYAFDGGTTGIVGNVEYHAGEYWVYVPEKSRKLSISHEKYGVLRDYNYDEAITAGTAYELLLDPGVGRFVSITTSRASMPVFIDGDSVGLSPLPNTYLLYGRHDIKAESGRLLGEKTIVVSDSSSHQVRVDVEDMSKYYVNLTMKVEGEVAEPSLTFFWDCFSQQLQVIWLNAHDYATTDYPQTMEINMGGVTDTLEMDSATTAYTVAGAEVGQTYEVDVTVTFDSNYVSNSSFELDLGSVTCDEQANFAPEGYSYNSGLYSYADFPIAGQNFDLAAGGEIGRWKIVRDPHAWMSVTRATAEYLIYTATPTDTAAGDAYTYSVLAANDDGSDVYTGGFGTMNSFTGTLHLYPDNTFKLELDAIYICTDLISNAEQWHNASTIEGCWYENGAGTVDLSYNLGSETDLGKGTR